MSRTAELRRLDRAFLQSVARTMQTLNEQVNHYIAQRLAENNVRTDATFQLSRREREVFTLVVKGLTNKEIAANLCISERTAKFHVSAILKKCGVGSRIELLREHRIAPNLDLVVS